MKTFNDFIVVEPALEEQRESGLYLVDIVDKQLRKGTVVSKGEFCKSSVEVGQLVVYAVSGGFAGFGDPVRLDLDGKKYDLITEKQLVIVLEK